MTTQFKSKDLDEAHTVMLNVAYQMFEHCLEHPEIATNRCNLTRALDAIQVLNYTRDKSGR